jgi:hypothetical protein
MRHSGPARAPASRRGISAAGGLESGSGSWHAMPLWSEVNAGLEREGWARGNACAMKAMLGADDHAWQGFVGGWDAMPLDRYMGDGGAYRRRRYGVYRVGPRCIDRLPRQPHHQLVEHNKLNGGIERWFAPLAPEVAESSILARVLAICRALFAPMAPVRDNWRAEVHQFRIEATACGRGLPTPEGRHRDGVTAGLALMIARSGVEGGRTRLWAPGGGMMAEFTMIDPGEALFFDDSRLLHEVTPLVPAKRDVAGHRDMLIVTYSEAG